MPIAYFFGFAAGGFVLMAAVGIQALVALFSSIPLTRRHVKDCPEFNTQRAYHRIIQVTVISCLLVGVASILIVHFAAPLSILGYLFGMVLAFVFNIRRMTPNNELNRKNYEESYTDCYPPSDQNPDDSGFGTDSEKHTSSSDSPGETGTAK